MPERAPTPQQTLALIFGASTYLRAPNLRQGPIFSNSAREVQEYLTSPNGLALPFENVRWLFDDVQSPSDQMQDFRNFLEVRTNDLKGAGTPAQDLIVYYVGHGLFSGPSHDYGFAISTTDAQLKGPTSIRVGDLAAVIKAFAPFLRRFLILDCCFAASAFQQFQADPMEVGSEKLLAALPGRGTALLCSSSADDPSLAPQGHPRTLFTDSLLQSLHAGHPSLHSSFSFGELAELVKEKIRETGSDLGPRPEVHSPDQREGDVATIPFFPNPAWSPNWQSGKMPDGKREIERATTTKSESEIERRSAEAEKQSALYEKAIAVDASASESARLAEFQEFLSQATFQVSANALNGSIMRPIQQPIEMKVYTKLPREGGYITQRSEGYRVQGVVSYKFASSELFGELVGAEKDFRACSTVEGLNILEVITVDRIVSTISVDLSRLNDRPPTVELLGTVIENLRIGGYPIDVTLEAPFFELIAARAGFSLSQNGKDIPTRAFPYLQVRASYSQSFQQVSSNTIELRGGGRLILGELKIEDKSLSSTLLRYEHDRMGTISVANICWGIETL